MELKREFVLREIAGDTLLILGDEQTGIIVTKPDVIETAAAQIFEQMERQK